MDGAGDALAEAPAGQLCLDFTTTAGDSRRWRSMGDCGNRAKQRRHAQRLTASRAEE